MLGVKEMEIQGDEQGDTMKKGLRDLDNKSVKSQKEEDNEKVK